MPLRLILHINDDYPISRATFKAYYRNRHIRTFLLSQISFLLTTIIFAFRKRLVNPLFYFFIFTVISIPFKMNMNTSSSSLSPSESFTSSFFSDGPIRIPAPIVPLRTAHKGEGNLISDISSILAEQDVDHFHDEYQISRESFRIFAPSSSVRMNDQIPAEYTVIIYEEKLKAGLQLPMDPITFRLPSCIPTVGESWWLSDLFVLMTASSGASPSSLNCISWVLKETRSSDFSVEENARRYLIIYLLY